MIQKSPKIKNKTDPTGSLKLDRRYTNGILPLIDHFEERVIGDINTAWETGKVHSLDVGKIDPTKFYPHIDEIAEEEITEPSKKIITRIIPQAYDQGNLFASVVLGASPEERARQWTKIKVLVEDNKNEFKGFSDDLAKRVKRVIGDGIVAEKKQGEIVIEIKNECEMSDARAIRIIRTETMRAVNTGVKDRYRRAGVEYVRWLACDDDRTCDECADLDGETFPIDDAPNAPLHPGCRCTVVPVIQIPGEEEE